MTEIQKLIASGIKKVSNSRVSCYLACPQKHYFSYIMKLRSNRPVRPLTFGGDFHKLLEYRHNKEKLKKAAQDITKAYEELHPAFQADLGDNYLDDLKTIFKDYTELYKDSVKPIETEHELLVEMGKFRGECIYFHGIIDEVYPNLLMGEHKTFNQRPNMETLAMNMQVCLYAKAWEIENGVKLQTVQWDYIKSAPAKFPIWLDKSNRFSEAANEGITPNSWLRACKARGIHDPAILNKAFNYSQNTANFFFRCRMEILPSMVDTVWNDFRAVVLDLFKRGETNKVKNITRDCSWCTYRPICYAEFTGMSTGYVIEKDFIVKPEVEDIPIISE